MLNGTTCAAYNGSVVESAARLLVDTTGQSAHHYILTPFYLLYIQGGPKKQATTFEGSHRRLVFKMLEPISVIFGTHTSTSFYSEHIRLFSVPQIHHTKWQLATPGESYN